MGIYEKIVHNMEVSVSVGILSVGIFTPNLRESFGGFFCLKFYILQCILSE